MCGLYSVVLRIHSINYVLLKTVSILSHTRANKQRNPFSCIQRNQNNVKVHQSLISHEKESERLSSMQGAQMSVTSPMRLMREAITARTKTAIRNGKELIKCWQSLMTASTGERESLMDASNRFTSLEKMQLEGIVPFTVAVLFKYVW